MKKISKLSVAALLSLGLVLSACGGKGQKDPTPSGGGDPTPTPSGEVTPTPTPTPTPSVTPSPTVEPVKRIVVTQPRNPFTVGDTFDLDDYVNVTGGPGPKVFDAAPKASSEDLVSINGHIVTVLDEGNFEIAITAGAKSATLRGEGASLARLALKDLFKNMENGFGIQLIEFDEENPEDYDMFLGMTHTDNYCFHYYWDEDEEKNPLPGGFLKTNEGKTLNWVADDLTGKNMTVEYADSDFDNYFFGGLSYILLNASDFAHEFELDEESGEEIEYFILDDSVASPDDLADYFPTAVSLFAYAGMGYDISSDKNTALYAYPEFNEETKQYEFGFVLSGQEGKEDYAMAFQLTTDPEEYRLGFVEEFIENGGQPAAVDLKEMEDLFAAAIEAQNYTYFISGAWVNPTTGDYVDCPETLVGYEYDKYFFCGDETGLVMENQKLMILRNLDADVIAQFGYIEHENQLYSFEYIDEEEEESEPYWQTTAIEGETSLWEGKLNTETLAAVTFDNAAARSREEGEGYVKFNFKAVELLSVFEPLMNSTYAGYLLNAVLSQGWTSDMRDYLSCSMIIAEGNQMAMQAVLTWDENAAYVFRLDLAQVGTTTLEGLEEALFPQPEAE